MRFLSRIYGLLLTLYPREYRDEFSEELQKVFNLSLNDAMKNGGLEIIVFVMRELFSLPKAVVLEHLRERRRAKMIGRFASHFDFVPGSWKEGVAMLAPFALFAICFYMFYHLIVYLFASGLMSTGVNIVPFVVVFWLLGFSLFAFDFVKGPPRWFMPYIGLLLPIFNLFIYEDLIFLNWNGAPALYELTGRFLALSYLTRFLGEFINRGLLWVGLFFLLIVLVITTRFIPKFRLFHQRLRNDWTLLSFIAYGTVPYAVIYSFGDYEMDFANQGYYLLLVFVIFTVGGWLYLRANTPLKKFLSLFVAMALSMFVAELSRAILYDGPIPGLQLTWQTKLLQLDWRTKIMEMIVTWMWLALFLLLPVLVKWLPDESAPSKLSLNEG